MYKGIDMPEYIQAGLSVVCWSRNGSFGLNQLALIQVMSMRKWIFITKNIAKGRFNSVSNKLRDHNNHNILRNGIISFEYLSTDVCIEFRLLYFFSLIYIAQRKEREKENER